MAEGSAASTSLDRCQLAPAEGLLTHCKHHKVRKQQSVQAEVPAEVLRVDPGVHDEDPGVGVRRRNRRPAALEDQEAGVDGFGHGQGSGEVGVGHRARQPPAGSPGTHGGHACAHGVLDVVTGSMAPGVEEPEQRTGVELRPGVDDLGLGWPAPAHGDDHRLQPRISPGTGCHPGDRSLARAFPRPDDRHRGCGGPQGAVWRGEGEVGPGVGGPGPERHRGHPAPLPVAEHRIVG